MILIKRSIFPLSKIDVKLNDLTFSLKPNESKSLEINHQEIKTIDIEISNQWITNKETIPFNDHSTIKIVSAIPDLYYLLGGGISILLCVLLFLGLVSPLWLVVSFIYILPLIYYSFFAKKKYFKVYHNHYAHHFHRGFSTRDFKRR
ncbi:hypothetical protein [Riemerella columbina]|uniref:hypothetical protein n=1 Tax=Riemerella columbina TaxID=103810 RepID=UPI0026702499|nr:hypothetical protein [Riemerella columbina]WKS95722.1 hypothetical protein NYR17_02990 [Riemerella columbina]